MAINERNYVGYAINPKTGKPHTIRHLPKMPEWEKGVYLYESGDKFIADIDGIDNLPGQQLANRTEFLYEQNSFLGEACRGLLAILKDISTGKVEENGYPIAVAGTQPASQSTAWVKPQDNLGAAAGLPFVVTEPGGEAWDNPVAHILPAGLPECYLGSGKNAFPRVRKVVGTFSLDIAPTDLLNRDAWVKTEGETDIRYDVSCEVLLDDSTKIHSPTAVIIDGEDDVFYLKTYEESTDPDVPIDGYEIATHGDIDAIFPVTR